jgi:phosphoribosylformylglycinamidine synthase subunit PurQ / glutaminase
MKPKALILTGVGINSNRELAEAFELAGATAEQMHISALEAKPERILDYQCLAFPGGFSYGDHIASGKILGNLVKAKAGHYFTELKARGVPMIGICNGFQILVKMGWLPQLDGEPVQQASLIHNDSARYENRWVKLGVCESAKAKSPWLKGIDTLDCPVRHGEGKLVLGSEADLDKLEKSGQVALRYLKNGESSQDYPENPNGSFNAIAGLIDPTGLIFGLMPHPEVAIHGIQNPNWSRLGTEGETNCLKLFKNIVRYIQSK